MNLFYLHEDPAIAASYMCDVHILSQIRETAQMLSTAHHVIDGERIEGKKSNGHKYVYWHKEGPLLYKCTHLNHPSTIWVRTTTSNYRWAFEHFEALLQEFRKRYPETTHKTAELLVSLSAIPTLCPEGMLTPVAQAMPLELQGEDPVIAYRSYYQSKSDAWASEGRPMTWGTEKPEWLR